MQIYLSLHHIVIAAVITASLAPQYDMLVHGSDSTHTQWIVLDTNGQVLDVDPAPYISKQQQRLLSKERKSHVEKKIVPTLDRVTFEDPVEILPSSSANDRKSTSIDVPVDTVEVRNTLDLNSEVEIVVELVQPPINTDVKLEKSESVISSQGIIPSSVPVHNPVDTMYADDEEDEFAPGFFLPEFKVKKIEASEQAIYRIKEFQIVRLVSDVFGWKGIEGSILFAEVSCYAVAMAAEAVYAAGLYGEMPWYEQVIMMISVLGALLYQVLVGAWYFEWLSSETMLSCTTVIIMMTVLKMVIPSLHSSLIWIFTGQLPHQYDPVPPSAGKPTSSTSKSFKHGRHTSKSSSAA